MFTVYFVIGIIIAVIAVLGSCIAFFFMASEESDPKGGLQIGSTILFSGLVIAILWPVLIAGLAPALLIYGAFNTARTIKHKGFDYV